MIEHAIYSLLSTHTALTAIVGTRIQPVTLKQGTQLPALTYMRVSTIGEPHAHSGPLSATTSRFQFTSISSIEEGPDKAKEISLIVRKLFQGYRGTVATVPIIETEVLNEVDIPGSEDLGFGVALDISFQYRINY